MAYPSLCPAEAYEPMNGFFRELQLQPKAFWDRRYTAYSSPDDKISVIFDSYNGCHVKIAKLSIERLSEVQRAIARLFETIKEKNAVDSFWIDFVLPVNSAVMSLIPQSFVIGDSERGDLIQDYQDHMLRAWQWLNSDKKCAIPPGATHNIGATALLCDTKAQKVLLVVNTKRDRSWNLPGGSYDPNKDKTPADTALREAQEEGGLTFDRSAIKEQRLIGQMEFPKNQFARAINQIWFFAAPGLSQLNLNPPPYEIKRAKWIDYRAIEGSSGTLEGAGLGEEIKTPLLSAIRGLGAREIVNGERMIVYSS